MNLVCSQSLHIPLHFFGKVDSDIGPKSGECERGITPLSADLAEHKRLFCEGNPRVCDIVAETAFAHRP